MSLTSRHVLSSCGSVEENDSFRTESVEFLGGGVND